MSSRTDGITDIPVYGGECCLLRGESSEMNCRVALPPDVVDHGLSR